MFACRSASISPPCAPSCRSSTTTNQRSASMGAWSAPSSESTLAWRAKRPRRARPGSIARASTRCSTPSWRSQPRPWACGTRTRRSRCSTATSQASTRGRSRASAPRRALPVGSTTPPSLPTSSKPPRRSRTRSKPCRRQTRSSFRCGSLSRPRTSKACACSSTTLRAPACASSLCASEAIPTRISRCARTEAL
eukprot:Amastigsp_a174983_16.p2 type:complete len:194 gc:universal Amastigsp_a174983_16:602-21(-)